MMFSLVTDLACVGVPVAVACGVLKFSRQAYYQWLAHPVSERALVDAYAIDAALDFHADDPGFGYRFIADELAAAGHTVSERRVWRLCRQQRITSAHSRKRGKAARPGPPVHDDLVRRDFTAEAPNRLWLTDITEHPTAGGEVYLCAVMDAWSRRIVGYSISDRMTARLAVDALTMAVARRGGQAAVAGCVVHSDRGSQFRSRTYVCALAGFGMSGRWARSARSRTTPRWSPSSPCCRRTSWTATAGPPATSYAWPSSPGSRRPTTAGDGNEPSASSPRPSLRP